MPLNYKKLKKSGLSNDELVYLLTLQGKSFIEFDFTNLLEQELVKEVAIKKSQERYEGIRISPKGTAFLKKLFEADEVEGIEALMENLKAIYENYGHKDKIGNFTEASRRFNWFMTLKEEYSAEQIEGTIENYVRFIDDPKYLTKLENLPTKNDGAFKTAYSLDRSKLLKLLEE